MLDLLHASAWAPHALYHQQSTARKFDTGGLDT